MLKDHLADWFSGTGLTCRWTSGEYVETLHQQILKSEKKHGLRTRTYLGTKAHLRRLGRSSSVFAIKNLGFLPVMKWILYVFYVYFPPNFFTNFHPLKITWKMNRKYVNCCLKSSYSLWVVSTSRYWAGPLAGQQPVVTDRTLWSQELAATFSVSRAAPYRL